MKRPDSLWYKCDFHVHTTQSSCFANRKITAAQWIQAALDAGLQCIAVTDHNDYREIDEIKTAASGKDIVVFPGTEVSCSNPKIHVLVLFDVDVDGKAVQTFLEKCDIRGTGVGSSRGTGKSIFEVCEIARTFDCLAIPAHIDDFHGLCSMAYDQLIRLLDKKYIDAVQIDNQDIWGEAGFRQGDEDAVYLKLQERYNADISIERAREWQRVYLEARKTDIPMLTFSDNPHEAGDSHHGLWGIGKQYTWIRFQGEPNLANLRQALLFYKDRIRNCFASPEDPGADPFRS